MPAHQFPTHLQDHLGGGDEISTVNHWKCAQRLFAHGTGYTETPVVMPRLIIHQQVLPNVSHLLAIFQWLNN